MGFEDDWAGWSLHITLEWLGSTSELSYNTQKPSAAPINFVNHLVLSLTGSSESSQVLLYTCSNDPPENYWVRIVWDPWINCWLGQKCPSPHFPKLKLCSPHHYTVELEMMAYLINPLFHHQNCLVRSTDCSPSVYLLIDLFLHVPHLLTPSIY